MAESDQSREAATRVIAERNLHHVGGTLRALREVVLEQGYVDRADEHVVADVFNLSQAEVRGIVSFYHDLKTTPQPPVTVKVCRAEACQAVGARALTAAVTETLGIGLGETAADGSVSLEAVYCLSGSGELTYDEGRAAQKIVPGTLYALDRHDRHKITASEELRLVCVFNPAVAGHETHDAEGGYEPVSD